MPVVRERSEGRSSDRTSRGRRGRTLLARATACAVRKAAAARAGGCLAGRLAVGDVEDEENGRSQRRAGHRRSRGERRWQAGVRPSWHPVSASFTAASRRVSWLFRRRRCRGSRQGWDWQRQRGPEETRDCGACPRVSPPAHSSLILVLHGHNIYSLNDPFTQCIQTTLSCPPIRPVYPSPPRIMLAHILVSPSADRRLSLRVPSSLPQHFKSDKVSFCFVGLMDRSTYHP